MRWSSPARCIPLALLALAIGCSAGDADPGAPAVGEPSSASTVAIGTEDAWYHRGRVLDLTGDGDPDSVDLRVVGDRTDSLSVVLTLHVDGAEAHRVEWGSSYELAMADSASLAGGGADSILRGRLDDVLASVAPGPLGGPGLRLMLEDSSVLQEIDPRPSHGLTFAYGYETTSRLAWDAPRGRFVRLWSCC